MSRMGLTCFDVRAGARAAARMLRDGAIAVDGLFPDGLLKRIRAEVLRRHESGELRERGLVRDIAGRYAAVLPFSGPFLEPAFYANPALHRLLGRLLGKDYCISSLETVIASPGAYDQHQHIDGPIRFDPFKGKLPDLPPYAVTVSIPLCDMDEDNGPTSVWLGSHREALRARPPGEREVRRRFEEAHFTGPFGRAYLFDYRIFHGGTANHTAETRPVVMFIFTRSWFRDPNLGEVRPRLVLKERDFKRVPARHQPLFRLAPAARRALWQD